MATFSSEWSNEFSGIRIEVCDNKGLIAELVQFLTSNEIRPVTNVGSVTSTCLIGYYGRSEFTKIETWFTERMIKEN